MIGNSDRQPREITPPLMESGAITSPRRKLTAGQMLKRGWLQAVAFVVFLGVFFLFGALGLVGN